MRSFLACYTVLLSFAVPCATADELEQHDGLVIQSPGEVSVAVSLSERIVTPGFYGQFGLIGAAGAPLFSPIDSVDTLRIDADLRLPIHQDTSAHPNHLRIALGFSIGDDTNSASLPGGTSATFVAVDGLQTTQFGSSQPNARIDADLTEYRMLATWNEEIWSGAVTRVESYVGIKVNLQHQSSSIDISTPFAGGTLENPVEMTFEARQLLVGPAVGLTHRVVLGSNASLDLGASGSILYAHSNASASSCVGNAVALGEPCNGGFAQALVNDSSNQLTYHLAAFGELGLNTGLGELFVRGQLDHLGHNATARFPTVQDRRAMSLEYSDETHFSVGFGFRLNL